MKFNIGDKVVLCGCPYDEQIPEEAEKFSRLVRTIQTVTDVKDTSHIYGTSGQWVKTDLEPDWTDGAWFIAAINDGAEGE